VLESVLGAAPQERYGLRGGEGLARHCGW
jgi:hypothetical protein